MTCKHCGETIEPEEPDIRYRPGDGEHRLDFHVECWSTFSFDALMWAMKSGESLPDEEMDGDEQWKYYQSSEYQIKERP